MPTGEEIHGTVAAYPAGQRLRCDSCGAEIAIIKPCPAHPPDQVFQCCGREMCPAIEESKDDAWDV